MGCWDVSLHWLKRFQDEAVVFKYVCNGVMVKGRLIISTWASYAIDGDSVSR